MIDSAANDDSPDDPPARGPDSQGEAALLLVESLIHGLIERSVIDNAVAIDIVGTAAEVSESIAGEPCDSPDNRASSLALLKAIHASLMLDRTD